MLLDGVHKAVPLEFELRVWCALADSGNPLLTQNVSSPCWGFGIVAKDPSANKSNSLQYNPGSTATQHYRRRFKPHKKAFPRNSPVI